MNEEVKESAKAVQEVAKTTTEAIRATEKLGKFVSTTIAEPLTATIGILTDKLQFMRWERQVRLTDCAMEIIKRRQLYGKVRVVPPKLAFPIIENASLEEEDFLQDMWVNLLVSAMDPCVEMPRMTFVDIIKQLTPTDTRILQCLNQEYILNGSKIFAPDPLGKEPSSVKMPATFTSPSIVPIRRSKVIEKLGLSDEEQFEISIDNLVRQGCVTLYRDVYIRLLGENDLWNKTNYDQVCITSLGVSFVGACAEPEGR